MERPREEKFANSLARKGGSHLERADFQAALGGAIYQRFRLVFVDQQRSDSIVLSRELDALTALSRYPTKPRLEPGVVLLDGVEERIVQVQRVNSRKL